MRLYHPTTLTILSLKDQIPKRYSCSVWSESFKWKASGQKHPKCFIDDDYDLGIYLSLVYDYGTRKGCKLDKEKISSFDKDIVEGFYDGLKQNRITRKAAMNVYFDDNYLFSDACSLYFKGINIFEDLFHDKWRKYVPVESHTEILRQVTKTINK